MSGCTQAQIDKLRHIAAKLRLEPGMHVAEIGSGWGALGTFLARNYGVTVTSVTLSPEQLAVARAARRRRGRGRPRDVPGARLPANWQGSYDRVVSIAMMEAIGICRVRRLFRGTSSG